MYTLHLNSDAGYAVLPLTLLGAPVSIGRPLVVVADVVVEEVLVGHRVFQIAKCHAVDDNSDIFVVPLAVLDEAVGGGVVGE